MKTNEEILLLDSGSLRKYDIYYDNYDLPKL